MTNFPYLITITGSGNFTSSLAYRHSKVNLILKMMLVLQLNSVLMDSHAALVLPKRGRSPLMQGMIAHFGTFPNVFFRSRMPRPKLNFKFEKAVLDDLAKTVHYTTPRQQTPTSPKVLRSPCAQKYFSAVRVFQGISQIAKLPRRSGKRTPQKYCFRVCAKIKRHQKVVEYNPRHHDSVC